MGSDEEVLDEDEVDRALPAREAAVIWSDVNWDRWATCNHTRPSCISTPEQKLSTSVTIVQQMDQAILDFGQLQMLGSTGYSSPNVFFSDLRATDTEMLDLDKLTSIHRPKPALSTPIQVYEIADDESDDDFCIVDTVIVPRRVNNAPAKNTKYYEEIE